MLRIYRLPLGCRSTRAQLSVKEMSSASPPFPALGRGEKTPTFYIEDLSPSALNLQLQGKEDYSMPRDTLFASLTVNTSVPVCGTELEKLLPHTVKP